MRRTKSGQLPEWKSSGFTFHTNTWNFNESDDASVSEILACMHAMCDENGNKNVDGALFGRVIIRALSRQKERRTKKRRFSSKNGIYQRGRSRMSANVYCAFEKLSKIHPSFCSRSDPLYRGRVYLTASYTRDVRRTKASDFYGRGERFSRRMP